MPYSHFTDLQEIAQKFNIQFINQELFEEAILPIMPTSLLIETLRRSLKMPFISEKERSEAYLRPILTELCFINDYKITLYSGRDLNADKKMGLNGECDFMLSFGNMPYFVDVPIFTVVKAKKHDIEYGIAQCSAQMIGAYKYNHNSKKSLTTIYGAATTGKEWKFLKLIDNTIFINETNQSAEIEHLPILLGTLQHIVNQCKTLSEKLS
jgi:hypothetical protein